jgi:hypothetical protein
MLSFFKKKKVDPSLKKWSEETKKLLDEVKTGELDYQAFAEHVSKAPEISEDSLLTGDRVLQYFTCKVHLRSLRIIGLATGFSIILYSLACLFFRFQSLTYNTGGFYVLLLLQGIFACVMESKEEFFSAERLEALKREALCLYHPYGRYYLNSLVAMLICYTEDNLWIRGICVIIFFVSERLGNSAAISVRKIEELQPKILEDSQLLFKFKRKDKNKEGFLKVDDFYAVIKHLGTFTADLVDDDSVKELCKQIFADKTNVFFIIICFSRRVHTVSSFRHLFCFFKNFILQYF